MENKYLAHFRLQSASQKRYVLKVCSVGREQEALWQRERLSCTIDFQA